MIRTALAALLCLMISTAAIANPDRPVDADGAPEIRNVPVPAGTVFRDLFPDWNAVRDATDIDPGPAPEGDYLGWPVYTRDGSRILVSNRGTNNITVFDASSMDALATIPVGTYPAGIAVSNTYAVVACAFSDEVWILDLSDYTVAAVIPAAEQPWVTRVSPDGTRAYVACDIPDVLEIIDLTTLSHLQSVNGFPISLLSFSWGSENGRNGVSFTGFELSPDGTRLVTGDRASSVRVYDALTGALVTSVPGIADCTTVGFSGDGSRLIALSATNPMTAHQIDAASWALLGSVTLHGYTLSTHQVAVNQDGSKAFLGVSDNSSAFVRFTAGDFSVNPNTYTPFSLGSSPDHSLALGIQYRFSVLDFATEALLGQIQGISVNTSAVSPVGAKAVAFDPIRDESLNFYDYSLPSNPSWLGATPTGEAPEGDAPRRVAITPDGSKVIVVNVLSDNLSVIDLDSREVTVIDGTGDRTQNLAITSDSRWAVACGMDSHSIFVVDLELGVVAAEVPTALRPGTVVITPGDAFAYVGNIQSNTVSVIVLDGAASYELTEFYCGVIGVSFAAYGVSSGIAMAPDGDYCLVAASFDDQVKVIDTASNSIVSSLLVGDFPLSICFENTGDYAVVTNWYGDSYSVLRIDGAGSSVVGTWARGDGPLRNAYDPVNDVAGIGHYYSKTLTRVDPRTGGYVGTTSYNAHGNLIQVGFDEQGDPLALTIASGDIPARFHRASESFDLPASPSFFAYDGQRQTAAVVMPGPDWVTLLEWDMTGVTETTLPLSAPGSLGIPQPNPFRSEARIDFSLRRDASAQVRILDAAGRRVAVLSRGARGAGDHVLRWDGRDDAGRALPAGVYFVELRMDGYREAEKLVLLR